MSDKPGKQIVTTPLEAELAARVDWLRSLLVDYAEHLSRHCNGRCVCGLDDALAAVGLVAGRPLRRRGVG